MGKKWGKLTGHPLNVRLSVEDQALLTSRASQEGRSESEVMRAALRAYCREGGKTPLGRLGTFARTAAGFNRTRTNGEAKL